MLSPNADHKLDDLQRIAGLGHPIFRLPPGCKSPAEGGPGLNSATCIPQLIEALHEDQPDANWAMRVDHLAVDLDDYKIDKLGFSPWPATEEQGMDLAGAGAVSITRNGGRQYHFAIPEGKSWTSGAGQIHPAVDVRAGGKGYVLLPPSFVEPDAGTGGDGHYRWVEGCELAVPSDKLPLPPQWLVGLVDEHHTDGEGAGKARESKPHNPRRAENWPELLSGVVSFANTSPPDIAKALELVLSSGDGATIDEQLEDGTTHLRCNQKKAGLSGTWDAPEDRGPDDAPRLRVRGGSWPGLMEAGAHYFKFSVWDILLAFEDGAEERLRADYRAALEAGNSGWDIDEFLRKTNKQEEGTGTRSEYNMDDESGLPLVPGFINLTTLDPKPPEFQVPGLFTAGLSVIAADGGTGKSTFMRQIMADLCRGQGKFAHPSGKPVSVALLSAEDSPETVILPELFGMGMVRDDFARLLYLPKMPSGGRFCAGDEGLAMLRQACKIRGDVRLAVIDPFQSFMTNAGKDSNNTNDARAALDPYHHAGMELGCAVVALAHLNKNQAATGQGKVAGNHQIAATTRAIYLAERKDNCTSVTLDKTNESGHVKQLAFTRHSLDGPDLAKALEAIGDKWDTDWPTDGLGRLEWVEPPEPEERETPGSAVAAARTLIMTHLAMQSEWVPLATLNVFCIEQGASKRATDIARKELVGEELVVEGTILGGFARTKFLATRENAERFGPPGEGLNSEPVDEVPF